MSKECDKSGEYILNCNGIRNSKYYTCVSEKDYYVVSGLSHSGIFEFNKEEMEKIVEKVNTSAENEIENKTNEEGKEKPIPITQKIKKFFSRSKRI